ncbi:MAG TPA: hypothetical protein VGS07_13550 [Thermoanaerobaculia bacterium]|jgi:hypothetical protein|nr:hypothetical protein [Thermoanaerobaculia bacterium]
MSQNLRRAVNTAQQATRLVGSLEPLKSEKNVAVAGLLGFFFGAIGVAIYFRSWKDFFCLPLVLVALAIVVPGIGVIPGWIFSAVYGMYRANTSNEKLAR